MMDEMLQGLRAHDLDRYLASLFVPAGKRTHVTALYAFNAEIARIAYSVSEPQLAEIRLQYWLDAIDGLYDGLPQAHPLATMLGRAIKEGDIPKFALVDLCKAHQFDFYTDSMATLDDLEAYLGATDGAVAKMAAMILNQDQALETSQVAGLLGVAYGLMKLFNKFPQSIEKMVKYVPRDMLDQRQIGAGLAMDTVNNAGFMVVLADLRGLVERRLRAARDVAWTVKEQVFPAFLPAALIDAYLDRAHKLGPQVVTQSCDISQLRKQWILWRAARTQSF